MNREIAKALSCAGLFLCLTGCVSAVIGNFSKPPGVSDEKYSADYAECRAQGDQVASQTSIDGGLIPIAAPSYLRVVDQCMAAKGYTKK